MVGEVLRRMPGGTQAVLALCGNKSYIIKCRFNAQGPNILANELIGTVMMNAMGLPTPPWRFAKVTSATISSLPSDEGPYLKQHNKCGLHFGSRVPEPSSRGRLYSFLPSSFVQRIQNRSDFIGAVVFDVWAGSQDPRQAVYVEDHRTRTFKAVFVDQGHLFGGPHWLFDGPVGGSLCLDHTVYQGLIDASLVKDWIARLGTIVPPLLSAVVKAVPLYWYNGDASKLKDTLLRRIDRLGDLVQQELDTVRVPKPTRYALYAEPPRATDPIFRERTGGSWGSAAPSHL